MTSKIRMFGQWQMVHRLLAHPGTTLVDAASNVIPTETLCNLVILGRMTIDFGPHRTVITHKVIWTFEWFLNGEILAHLAVQCDRTRVYGITHIDFSYMWPNIWLLYFSPISSILHFLPCLLYFTDRQLSVYWFTNMSLDPPNGFLVHRTDIWFVIRIYGLPIRLLIQ